MKLFFTALNDETRLRLLSLMNRREVCVYFLVKVLGESQPKISRHLAALRNAGIVEARRDGKWIHYKIIEPENDFKAQILRHALEWLNSDEKMREDYKRLTEISRFPDTALAPHPNIFAKTNVTRKPVRELETFLL